MGPFNLIMAALNSILLCLGLYYYSSHSIQHLYYDIEYKDFISILLTAISVILAAVTIFIALLAIWGYTSIKAAAMTSAEIKATEIAAQVADKIAREVAMPVAAREAQAAAKLYAGSAGGTQGEEDELTGVLSTQRTDNGNT